MPNNERLVSESSSRLRRHLSQHNYLLLPRAGRLGARVPQVPVPAGVAVASPVSSHLLGLKLFRNTQGVYLKSSHIEHLTFSEMLPTLQKAS